MGPIHLSAHFHNYSRVCHISTCRHEKVAKMLRQLAVSGPVCASPTVLEPLARRRPPYEFQDGVDFTRRHGVYYVLHEGVRVGRFPSNRSDSSVNVIRRECTFGQLCATHGTRIAVCLLSPRAHTRTVEKVTTLCRLGSDWAIVETD